MVKTSRIEKFYTALIFIFLYAPILILMIYSFNSAKSRGNWGGFTLKWYVDLLKDGDIMRSLYYTLVIAVISSLISTIIGTFAAIGIHKMKSWNKKIVLNINSVPILNPDIVTGVALMALFIFIKLELGFLTLLLAHISFNIPYVILAVLPKLRQLNKHTAEAALDLGATPAYAFTKVILPELMPGIVTGALIAFTLSIDDFVISLFTTGNGVSTLSVKIYSMTKRGIDPKINALSTLIFLSVLGLLVLINSRTEKTEEN